MGHERPNQYLNHNAQHLSLKGLILIILIMLGSGAGQAVGRQYGQWLKAPAVSTGPSLQQNSEPALSTCAGEGKGKREAVVKSEEGPILNHFLTLLSEHLN